MHTFVAFNQKQCIYGQIIHVLGRRTLIALLIDHLLLHAAVLTPAFEIVVVDGQFEYLAKYVHTSLHIVVCSLTL